MTYRARQVVGADGRHSVVARRMGAVRPHPWLDRMAIVTYLEGADRADALGEIFLSHNRYAILNPIAATLTNVGLVVRRRDLTQGEDPRRAVRRIAATLPGLADRLSAANVVAPVRCLGPLAHRASVLAAPGALLVGDAAGFLDPFTGEGIYAALRSAEIAARHVLEQGTPGGYDGAWRREFVPKWRIAALLQRAIRRERLADGLAAFLATRPRLTAALMAAFGDLLSPDALRPARLLVRLLAQLT